MTFELPSIHGLRNNLWWLSELFNTFKADWQAIKTHTHSEFSKNFFLAILVKNNLRETESHLNVTLIY